MPCQPDSDINIFCNLTELRKQGHPIPIGINFRQVQIGSRYLIHLSADTTTQIGRSLLNHGRMNSCVGLFSERLLEVLSKKRYTRMRVNI